MPRELRSPMKRKSKPSTSAEKQGLKTRKTRSKRRTPAERGGEETPLPIDGARWSETQLRLALEGRTGGFGISDQDSAVSCGGFGLADLFESSRLGGPERLQSLSGVGPSLALRLWAAHEVGRRSQRVTWNCREPFRSARQVHEHLLRRWVDENREHFCLLMLDVRHRLIRDCVISIGSLTASIVHPREVFRPAVIGAAAAVILAHNHPSGDPQPSDEDLRVTQRLFRCGQWLGIPVLDHVICGRGDWCSLRETGQGPWDRCGDRSGSRSGSEGEFDREDLHSD